MTIYEIIKSVLILVIGTACGYGLGLIVEQIFSFGADSMMTDLRIILLVSGSLTGYFAARYQVAQKLNC